MVKNAKYSGLLNHLGVLWSEMMVGEDGDGLDIEAREAALKEIPHQAIVHLLDETANSIQKRVAFRVIDKILSNKKVKCDAAVLTGPELLETDP